MSNVQKTTALVETSRQGPDTPLAHRRPRYPLASCFPAELAAVSLGQGIAPRYDCNFQPLDIGVMPQKIHCVAGGARLSRMNLKLHDHQDCKCVFPTTSPTSSTSAELPAGVDDSEAIREVQTRRGRESFSGSSDSSARRRQRSGFSEV